MGENKFRMNVFDYCDKCFVIVFYAIKHFEFECNVVFITKSLFTGVWHDKSSLFQQFVTS